ncbi:hypothetical protein Xaut_3600 [Xanthobacter versatilis]|uniref:Helix-turn-helix domain-containing protein n=1 Tax=Xanthobacter autotrophicus (strain ATCC BAA-1158 / Py2) TaxID=78245 RepID=A7ILD5_XANP2|nr:hypothetical protein Xaut_3600 [Xanthobacter autotrophicus Py2]
MHHLMLKEKRTEIEAPMATAVENRMMDGTPFTYSGLAAVSEAAGGDEARDRVADRTIQKWRRRGWISFRRIKREVVWSLTAEGEDEKERREAAHG